MEFGDSIGLLGARHLLPGVKRSGASGAILVSAHPVTAGAEEMVDRAMGG